MGLINIIKPLSSVLSSAVDKSLQLREQIQRINFGNAKNRTRNSWVRSTNTTSVLGRPILILVLYLIEIGKGRLTVGKIYGGLLILENWKATKFGKVVPSDGQVQRVLYN